MFLNCVSTVQVVSCVGSAISVFLRVPLTGLRFIVISSAPYANTAEPPEMSHESLIPNQNVSNVILICIINRICGETTVKEQSKERAFYEQGARGSVVS